MPKRILLAGGTSAIQRMDEFFREKLKVEVDYFNPFRNIVVSESISDDDIVRHAQLMGETVGVALRHVMPCPLEVNLLPAKVVAEKEFSKKKPFFIMAGIGLVLAALCWLMYFSRIAAMIEERANLLRPQVNSITAVERQLSTLESERAAVVSDIMALNEMIGKRTDWAAIIDEVHSRMPDGMWLVSFVPREGVAVQQAQQDAGRGRSGRGAPAPAARPGTGSGAAYTRVEIRGMIFADMATDSTIRDFRDSLRASDYFREGVEETRITLSPMPGPDDYVREFTIEIGLEHPIEKTK